MNLRVWPIASVGRRIAGDQAAMTQIDPRPTAATDHLRGNAAFVFASLGDERGFDVILSILDAGM
jgi:hypothetical protein